MIVIHKTEPITVVRHAEIIPYTVGNVMFLQKRNHVSHPIFKPGDVGMAYGTEFTAPQDFIGIALDEVKRRLQVLAEITYIHAG